MEPVSCKGISTEDTQSNLMEGNASEILLGLLIN